MKNWAARRRTSVFASGWARAELGQVLDIVPNHMSLGRENRYWWDVLENGTSSRYASFFDIDWQPQEERLRNKVLVPMLADQYGRVLQAGGIKRDAAWARRFRWSARGRRCRWRRTTLPVILARAAEYAKSDTLSFLAASFGRLPAPEYADRQNDSGAAPRQGGAEGAAGAAVRGGADGLRAIDQCGRGAERKIMDALDDFLNQQNYRLAYWKTADQQLGYRRFFDVNTLIGLRVEREHVFEETHALVLDWLRRGVLDGVRVDHPDGLRDPLEYFRTAARARARCVDCGRKDSGAGGVSARRAGRLRGPAAMTF